MGREIRRVPMDFDWPKDKPWKGFIKPHSRECPDAARGTCHGGWTNAGKWLDALCNLIALLGQEAAQSGPEYQAHFKRTGRVYPHPYLESWGQAPRTQIPRDVVERIREIEDQGARHRAFWLYSRENPPQLLPLDNELAALVRGLAPGEDLGPFGGGMASYKIQKALRGIAGVPETWGICPTCKGDGTDPAAKEAYEAWQREDPPAGDGWQVWETVSEGSPISPVFATAEEVVRWLVDVGGYSEAGARGFVCAEWAPSGIITGDGRYLSGVDACAEE